MRHHRRSERGTRKTSLRTTLHTTGVFALILTVSTACDNVNWGGVDFAFVSPPPKTAGEEVVDAPESVPGVAELPTGPVLYHARRLADGGGELVPLAEIRGDSLVELADGSPSDRYWNRFVGEHLRRGTEFTLFHRGSRVGTYVVDSARLPQAGVCPALPRAGGALELSETAGEIPEFIALGKGVAEERLQPVDSVPRASRAVSVVGPILAERILRARGAGLPGNWQSARRQAVTFPIEESANPGFASTYLVGDTLGPGLDNQGHSLFFVASPAPGTTGYDTTYVDFTDYPTEGKAAPRVLDFLDWDRDGEVEFLLEVFGVADSWYRMVGQVENRWAELMEVRCEEPGAAQAARAAADSAVADTVGDVTGQGETGQVPQ